MKHMTYLIIAILLSGIAHATESELKWENKPELFSASLCTLVVNGNADGSPHVYRPGWEEYPSKNPLMRSPDGKKITFKTIVGTWEFRLSKSNYGLSYEHAGKQFNYRGDFYSFTNGPFEVAILKTDSGQFLSISDGGLCGSDYQSTVGSDTVCIVNMLPSVEPCLGSASI